MVLYQKKLNENYEIRDKTPKENKR